MARARHHTGAAALVAIAPSTPIAHLAVQHYKSKETMKKLKCERCERERDSCRGGRGLEDNENYLNIYSVMYVCRIRVYNRVIISSLITSTIVGSGRLAVKKCSILSSGSVYCGLDSRFLQKSVAYFQAAI